MPRRGWLQRQLHRPLLSLVAWPSLGLTLPGILPPPPAPPGADCNRLRIMADGNLKVCLFGANEVSLRCVEAALSARALLLLLQRRRQRRRQHVLRTGWGTKGRTQQ